MKLLRIPDGIINTVKTQAEASRWIEVAKEISAQLAVSLNSVSAEYRPW
jgi:hypothetical protein